MFEKNLPEKGGSFYIRSKIYFAKKQLMIDFPQELDVSKYNPGSEQASQEETPEEENKKGQWHIYLFI